MDNILTYKGYRAEIDFSYQNNCFTGKILGINDAVSFHGKTVAELKTAFHSALNEYLDKCKIEGQKPGKEYKGSFNVRVGQSLHESSVKASEDLGISLNQFVTDAIREKLDSMKSQANTFEIRMMTFPKSMAPYLDEEDSFGMFERNAMIMYPYIQRGVLSNGKAAEILGVEKKKLIDYYSSRGIPFTHVTPYDLNEDINTINKMSGKK